MNPIFTIALREVTRLRRRFGEGMSPLTVVLLLAALGLSAFTLRDRVTLGSGLYRVGLSGSAPSIQDNRFAVVNVDSAQGQALLAQKTIDALIIDARVLYRQDSKSQYAVGALKRYLERSELARLSTDYTYDLTFPLRVGISYLDPLPAPAPPGDGATSAATPAAPDLATQADDMVIIPSLMTPEAPFGQVLLALIYILPVTFTSIFFTSSFMDEKANRRLTILLSAPISPFQIIVGKMLPYGIFALAMTALIAILTHANVLLALAIYVPTILFIFAIYLMVPLIYRTFKDTTFISMLVTTLTTAYLVFPAMFAGVSDLAFMSPLTLAVKMYRDEPFTWREYLFPSLPMTAIFCLAVFSATRLLNEEYLMGYRAISRKLADAIYLVMDRTHPYLSVGLLSLLSIPVIYLGQLIILAIASNLPPGLMLALTLFAAAVVEEIFKSMGIVALVEHGIVHSYRQLLGLAFLSGLGFLIGEKLLLFFSVSMVSETSVSNVLFSSSGLLVVPLLAHFAFTTLTTVLYAKVKLRYTIAILLTAILHALYNWALTGGLQ